MDTKSSFVIEVFPASKHTWCGTDTRQKIHKLLVKLKDVMVCTAKMTWCPKYWVPCHLNVPGICHLSGNPVPICCAKVLLLFSIRAPEHIMVFGRNPEALKRSRHAPAQKSWNIDCLRWLEWLTGFLPDVYQLSPWWSLPHFSCECRGLQRHPQSSGSHPVAMSVSLKLASERSWPKVLEYWLWHRKKLGKHVTTIEVSRHTRACVTHTH